MTEQVIYMVARGNRNIVLFSRRDASTKQ